MSRFKIGDRVVCTLSSSRFKIGDRFTISGIWKGEYLDQYIFKETEERLDVESIQAKTMKLIDKPQIKVGSKWRRKDDDGSGFIAEVVSINKNILHYTSNHYPHITTTYSIDDWEGYMEPLPHQTESIITETTARSVKAGVYGNVELIKDANTSSGFAYVSLLRNSYTKRTLSDLIETLKQIHKVM